MVYDNIHSLCPKIPMTCSELYGARAALVKTRDQVHSCVSTYVAHNNKPNIYSSLLDDRIAQTMTQATQLQIDQTAESRISSVGCAVTMQCGLDLAVASDL